jgi:hypothetical protein
MTGGPSLDPPVYRPFALLAFAAVLLLGAPLGMWLLMRPAGAAAWLIWLHAAVQLFGFLATLIVGVAHHLLPRFTGRAVRPTTLTSWLFAGLAAALVLRVAGAMAPEAVAAAVVVSVGGALVHTITLAAFAAWVWRTLDPPPLRLVRVQLTLSRDGRFHGPRFARSRSGRSRARSFSGRARFWCRSAGTPSRR